MCHTEASVASALIGAMTGPEHSKHVGGRPRGDRIDGPALASLTID